ncbi:MAG: YraN family protein [Bacteroidia bacterium]|nr:YraN family protein [Bacteroidia bacterium]MDW8347200.1 YraN family protein [Bacteroidia bacterium]
MKKQHIEKGKLGEEIACQYLTEQGYDILFRNWKWEKAEIDIIAMEGEELVFVEVRLRTHAEDSPELSISTKKQRLLCQAASFFAETYNERKYKTVRFDVIGIHIQHKSPCLSHYKDVFR